MHSLSRIKYSAREGDKTSPFIWGHAARMLTNGGHWKYIPYSKFPLKKPRTKRVGYDQEVTEPHPSVSNASTTGSLVRQMFLAGFTVDEVTQALEDENNLGGAFWRWLGWTEKGEELQQRILKTRTLDVAGNFTIIPQAEPYKVKVSVKSYHVCPYLKVTDYTEEEYGITVGPNGELEVKQPSLHSLVPSYPYKSSRSTHMGGKGKDVGIMGTWVGSNGFEVDIWYRKVRDILQFLRTQYTTMARSKLIEALLEFIPRKGIVDIYLKWMEQEGYLTWTEEKHRFAMSNGKMTTRTIKVPHVTSKALTRELPIRTRRPDPVVLEESESAPSTDAGIPVVVADEAEMGYATDDGDTYPTLATPPCSGPEYLDPLLLL